MNLLEALQDLTAQIQALGINAVYNPQDLNLPGAWVTPGAIEYDILDTDNYSMAFDVYLIASNNDVTGSLVDLSEMVDKLRIAFAVPEATPVSVDLKNHGGAMPALLVTLQTTITKD
jgi:hypothetical protein